MAKRKCRTEGRVTYRTYLEMLNKSVMLMDQVVASASLCRAKLMVAVTRKDAEEVKIACDAILGLQRLHTISSNMFKSASSDLYFTGE